MSATSDHIPAPTPANRIPTFVKMIAAIMTPVIITVISLYIYGMQVQNEERIYSNISIAGVDVSGMTRNEAIQSLGLPPYEERIANTIVTAYFPDDSKLVITGENAGLWHNARERVAEAYSIGRGRGVIPDVISYLMRYNADEISLSLDFFLDEFLLYDNVAIFAEEYNDMLEASVPVIYDDRVVFTKGAGHVSVDSHELFEMIYAGVFESFEEERPVEIIYALPNTRNFAEEILEVRKEIFVEVLSSEFDHATNSATESATGVDFDPIEAARLVGAIESGETATFHFIFTKPEYEQEYLDGLLFRDLIGKRSTYVHGNNNRVNNINIASESINGYVLMPGEEFSFNRIVGRRSTEAGYLIAPALSQGETIYSIGGGVCQVSSTIYAAIRPSELKVTEQRRHSKPVPYLPWGWDATVFYDAIDFRFINNTDYPMRVDVELDERSLSTQVWGTIIDDFPRNADWDD